MKANPDAEAWRAELLARGTGSADHDGFSVPQSIGDTWEEAFRGEAALVLLCERDDEWVRRAVFDGVTGFFYGIDALGYERGLQAKRGVRRALR